MPYDGACTNRPGARFGPRSIREASHMLCDGIHPHFNKSPLGFLADLGDISSLPNTNLITLRQHLESYAKVLLKHKRHIVWLGGDHSITLSLLRAYHAEFGAFKLKLFMIVSTVLIVYTTIFLVLLPSRPTFIRATFRRSL